MGACERFNSLVSIGTKRCLNEAEMTALIEHLEICEGKHSLTQMIKSKEALDVSKGTFDKALLPKIRFKKAMRKQETSSKTKT